MNYSEIRNFYVNKEVHSNINYTFRKYTPIKTKSPPPSLQENDESFLNIIVKHCCFFESK